mgnify:CR=1 FL=1
MLFRSEVDGWYGLLAPAATPPAIIARFNADLVATVSTPEMKERLLGAGIDARASTPAVFHERITKDMSRWATGDVTIACVPSMAWQQLPPVIRASKARRSELQIGA